MFHICLKRMNFLIWAYRSKLGNFVPQTLSVHLYLLWFLIYLDFLFYFWFDLIFIYILSSCNIFLEFLPFFLAFILISILFLSFHFFSLSTGSENIQYISTSCYTSNFKVPYLSWVIQIVIFFTILLNNTI